MYARKWNCTCPLRHKEDFLAYLNETGVKETSSTPGFIGSQVLVREIDGAAEITLITYWDSLESIRAFAGEDIEMARLYPEDATYEIVAERHVTHYKVVQHSFLDSGKCNSL